MASSLMRTHAVQLYMLVYMHMYMYMYIDSSDD